ncbi:MAG TPA: DUF89 family protein [Firmicutes bacterium]|nr:DUF89 family protein [Bacillota bacterium]
MKVKNGCIECFYRQGITLSEKMNLNPSLREEIQNNIKNIVKSIEDTDIPAEIGRRIYLMISEKTGIKDPYLEVKRQNISQALELIPVLESKISHSKDPLLLAIKYAVAGNIIDFGTGKPFNIIDEFNSIEEAAFAVFDYNEFKSSLEKTEKILYIGDNAGESVFDVLLIKSLRKPVTYVVRSGPIINDVTFEDALNSGIDKTAEIISSGMDAPGTILKLCSDSFKRLFQESDMIISKGQGNFEGLSNEQGNIFFLLKVKCDCIADELNVSTGSLILKYSLKSQERV